MRKLLTRFSQLATAASFAMFLSVGSVGAAVSMQSISADALTRRGYVLVQSGSYRSAVSVLRNAISINPNDANSRRYLTYALIQLGDHAAAVKQLQLISKMSQPSAVDYCLSGNVQVRLGKNDQALQQYRSALILEPDMAAARAGIIELFILASDYQGATYLCNDCLAKSRNSTEQVYFQQMAANIRSHLSNSLAQGEYAPKTEVVPPVPSSSSSSSTPPPAVRNLIPLVIQAAPVVAPKIAPIATKAKA